VSFHSKIADAGPQRYPEISRFSSGLHGPGESATSTIPFCVWEASKPRFLAGRSMALVSAITCPTIHAARWPWQ